MQSPNKRKRGEFFKNNIPKLKESFLQRTANNDTMQQSDKLEPQNSHMPRTLDDIPDFISVESARRKLGLSRRTLDRYAEQGLIQYQPVGGVMKVSLSSVAIFLEIQRDLWEEKRKNLNLI